MIRRPPRSTLFPTRRSSDLLGQRVRDFLQQNGLAGARRRHDQSALSDRKSTRLNSSHVAISYAVFCLKKKIIKLNTLTNLYKRIFILTDYVLKFRSLLIIQS